MGQNLDRTLMAGIFAVFVFTAGFALVNNYNVSKNVYTSNAISDISVYPSGPCSQLTTFPGIINNPQTPNDPCAKQITPIPGCYCQNNYWTQACGFPFAGSRCDQPPPCICNPETLKWDGGCGPSWGQSCNINDPTPVLPTKYVSPSPPVRFPTVNVSIYPSISIPPPVSIFPSVTVVPTYYPPSVYPSVYPSIYPSITANQLKPSPTEIIYPTNTPLPKPQTTPTTNATTPRINTALVDSDLNGNCVIDTNDFLTAIQHFGQNITVHNKPVKVTVTYLSLMLANVTTKVCGN